MAAVTKRDGNSGGRLHSTTVAAQLAAGWQHNRNGWMVGWLRDCDAYGQRQREGNTMEDGDGGGTIAMGDGNGSTMDGLLPQLAVVSIQDC